jgi:hypothetical protein
MAYVLQKERNILGLRYWVDVRKSYGEPVIGTYADMEVAKEHLRSELIIRLTI